MKEKRRALGRGLGALIPTSAPGTDRPADIFFGERSTREPAGEANDHASDEAISGPGSVSGSRGDTTPELSLIHI